MTGPASVSESSQPVARGTSRQFVGFEIAGQRYLFRIEGILEITIPAAITRVPEVSAYVEGVTNLRGAIIPVVNLRRLFGLEPVPPAAETRMIVVAVGGRTMGCLVDAVDRIVRLDDAQVKPAPETISAGGPRYLEGFVRVGDDLLVLLDSEQLLAPDHLAAVHRLGRPPAGPALPEETP